MLDDDLQETTLVFHKNTAVSNAQKINQFVSMDPMDIFYDNRNFFDILQDILNRWNSWESEINW